MYNKVGNTCFKRWYKYAKYTIKSVILVLRDDINTPNVQ